MKLLLSVLGLVLIVVAVIYFVMPADQLPSFMPGHEAGGVSAVWPRTVTVSGAELAAPGLITAKSAARQAASASATAARRRLWVDDSSMSIR